QDVLRRYEQGLPPVPEDCVDMAYHMHRKRLYDSEHLPTVDQTTKNPDGGSQWVRRIAYSKADRERVESEAVTPEELEACIAQHSDEYKSMYTRLLSLRQEITNHPGSDGVLADLPDDLRMGPV
ncbi:hypothetical protein, partial [Igneacidithiobacillus copahuensis]|uniref:hypothetical protein n=1 Tax=Igneacidithiobacillus copahuensis TaxID=2724909 RepID=UPI001C068EA5